MVQRILLIRIQKFRNSLIQWMAFLTISLKVKFPLPWREGRCEKFGIYPLTLPSPAGGEGKHIEIRKKFPPP
jgi:hypothetical protein